jgi:hypothetical protein
MSDIFCEADAPLASKGGDPCRENFEVGCRKLCGMWSGGLGEDGACDEYLSCACDYTRKYHGWVCRIVSGSGDIKSN